MTISEAVEAVAKGLPPSFLALAVLNTIFLIAFGWFVLRVAELRQADTARREAFIARLADECLPMLHKATP